MVVIGGSEGIGLGIAINAVKRGAAYVSIVSRTESKLQAALVQLKAANKDDLCIIRGFACDATDSIKISNLFGFFEVGGSLKDAKAIGLVSPPPTSPPSPVDLLVLAAGVCICDRLTSLTDNDITTVINTNLLTVLLPIRTWFRLRETQSRKSLPLAKVCLISSQAGQIGIFGFSSYSATKFALRGIYEVLRMEGVKVNVEPSIAFPPNTDTPGFANENKRKPKETKMIEDVGGLLKPEQVANTILQHIEQGYKKITFGATGFALGILTAGVEPADTIWQLVWESLLFGPLRLLAQLVQRRWVQGLL